MSNELPSDIWNLIQEYIPVRSQPAFRRTNRQMYQLPVNHERFCCELPSAKEITDWLFESVRTGQANKYDSLGFTFTSDKGVIYYQYQLLAKHNSSYTHINTKKDLIDYIGADQLILGRVHVREFLTWLIIYEILSKRPMCKNYKECFIDILSQEVLKLTAYDHTTPQKLILMTFDSNLRTFLLALSNIIQGDKIADLCSELGKRFNIFCQIETFGSRTGLGTDFRQKSGEPATIISWLSFWLSNLKAADIKDIF